VVLVLDVDTITWADHYDRAEANVPQDVRVQVADLVRDAFTDDGVRSVTVVRP
jgi:hypothetical protein